MPDKHKVCLRTRVPKEVRTTYSQRTKSGSVPELLKQDFARDVVLLAPRAMDSVCARLVLDTLRTTDDNH
jgi:hypothetical protein